jgi:hypothetical protein
VEQRVIRTSKAFQIFQAELEFLPFSPTIAHYTMCSLQHSIHCVVPINLFVCFPYQMSCY